MEKMFLIITMFSFVMAGEMGLSAYGGLDMANVAIGEADAGVSYGMKPGITLGVNYNKLPVIVGLGISMRGSKYTVTGGGGNLNFTYLDISARYPYAVGPGNAYAGLIIGMNLKAELAPDTGDAIDWKDSDCTDCLNSLDYGLVFGYSYPFNETMGVSLGYYLGLADFSGDYGLASDPSTDKHTGILVNIDYDLPF